MSGASSPASYSTGGNPASYIPTGQPQADATYQNLIGNQFLPAASQVPGVNPPFNAYQQAAGLYPQAAASYGAYVTNPYTGEAIQGAQDATNIWGNVYSQLAGAPAALSGQSNQLLGTIPQLLGSGFDPQSALYNQLSTQSRDAANVANAGAGIGGTPYGASVAANAQNNFNLNWQAQQLARQQQATQAAGGALGAAGAGMTNAGNIGTGLAQGTGQFTQLPYQASLGVGNNQIAGLNTLQSMLQGQANLGGQSFALPQQTLNDLQSYLDVGQAAQAQGLAGGQMGVNQLGSGIGGAIGGANQLFGSSGLFPGVGSSIGSGIGGLFGGGTGGLSAADAAAFLPGGSTAGISAADLATYAPAFAGS